MNKESNMDSYEIDFCMAIVHTNIETGEKIEDIMHWSIIKFRVVCAMINKINKLKNSGSEGPSGKKPATFRGINNG